MSADQAIPAKSWQEELLATWVELGVPAFIDSIGLDFERDFKNPLLASTLPANPYAGYTWFLFDHPRLQPGVLHAHPAHVGSEPTLWEEWFQENVALVGATPAYELHHHLLRNHPHDGEEGQWRGIDDEHPTPVLDIQWHYINSKDATPSLLR